MSEARLTAALAAIDAANDGDPTREGDRGAAVLYGRRMSEELAALAPAPGAALAIACRAQHIRRWEIPRGDYPAGRVGYKKWRSTLARFHADAAAEIVVAVGFDQAMAERVGELIRKQRLSTDAEAQTLEDAAANVFVRYHLADFARQHPREKVIEVLRKTMAKMSENGLARATHAALAPELAALIEAAQKP